jgi:long-subunit fatty acid transport protein
MKLNRYICLVIMVLLFPSDAYAQYQDFFGVGARNGAVQAGTATATDYSAAYYNPAGLAFSKDMELAFAMEYLSLGGFQVSVQKDASAAKTAEKVKDIVGVSLGLSMMLGGSKPQKIAEPLIPCENCKNNVPLSAARCTFCKAEFEPVEIKPPSQEPPKPNRIGLGMYLFLPFPDLVQAQAIDPRTPNIYLYESNLRKIGLFVGVAYRFTDYFSLGIGVSLLADAKVDTEINQPFVGGVNVDFKETLRGDAAPNFGLRFSPFKRFWLALAYRGELSLKVEVGAGVTVLGVSALRLKVESITLFSPHQLSFGAGYEIFPGLTAAMDLTWYNWSRFKTTGSFVENVPGSIPITTQSPPEVRSQDIVGFRMGAEYIFWKNFSARMGYSYYPSPIKTQTGESNLLHADKHSLSFGGGYAFEFMGWKNQLDVFMQIHILPQSSNIKSDSNDTYGNTSLEGTVFQIGFTLKTEF